MWDAYCRLLQADMGKGCRSPRSEEETGGRAASAEAGHSEEGIPNVIVRCFMYSLDESVLYRTDTVVLL